MGSDQVGDGAAGVIPLKKPVEGGRGNATGFLSKTLGIGDGGAGVARDDPPK